MRSIYFIALFFLSFSSAYAQNNNQTILDDLKEIAVVDQRVMMPMRDGVRLCTDIYRPKGNGKYPIIFSRTPYNFNSWGDGEMKTWTLRTAMKYVKKGYAFVVQNERGRYFSEGEWDILGVPLTDGYDAFTWMKNQSWSNGKIGTIGCSSTAEWQMAVAALDHPSHACMVPQAYGAGVGQVGEFMEQGNWYRGGAEQMLFFSWLYSVEHDKFKPRIPAGASQEDLIRISRFYDLSPENPKVSTSEAFWHLPVADIVQNMGGKREIFDKMIQRKPNDPAWYKGGLYHDNMKIEIPGFWFVSWYDVSVSPNIALYNHLRKTSKNADDQYLIISPNLHCGYRRSKENTMIGEMSVGDARLNYEEQIDAWFDLWLKGEQTDFKKETPRVQYYTMGSNEWKSADQFPPAEAEMTPYYLNSNGHANSVFGSGMLATSQDYIADKDQFTYDPMNPVMSIGGNVCCTGDAIKAGARNQRANEARHDILVYSTETLEEGVEVTGFIETTLYVSSDAKDTDFTVKLVDVHPDGTAYNLDETIQRARYREGYDKEVWMEDEKVYEIKLSPLVTSNYFKKGHKIRIEISSSNFPRFTRNLNTGGDNINETEFVVAKNTIYHSEEYPSKVVLPIVKTK